MSKLDIILFVTAWVSIIMVLVMCKKENDREKSKGKYYCIYNDMTKCYEKCCNDCKVKNECDYCCEGECEKCEGRKAKNE